jgi:hypothetical protein
VQTTMQRLRRFFAEAAKLAVGALTPTFAGKLYEGLAGAVDSRRNILAEAKTFLRWCRSKGWTKTDAGPRTAAARQASAHDGRSQEIPGRGVGAGSGG